MTKLFPKKIQQKCWNESAGYFDFTPEVWVNLPADKQFSYAQAYQTWYAKRAGKPIEQDISGITMRLIPPGKFWMGSPDEDEETRHKVLISKAFYLGKYEVTQAQWQTEMGDNEVIYVTITRVFTAQWQKIMGNNPSRFKNAGRNAPVEMVSWDDCQTFCQRTGTQLPSEAQWEYACRAGSKSDYCFGDSESQLGDYAWYHKNSGSTTHPVGQKKPNAFGLYDMHGNVWEWCQDWYSDYPGVEITDPTGPASGSNRGYRGGGWYSLAQYCRSAIRYYSSPINRYSGLGLRCSA